MLRRQPPPLSNPAQPRARGVEAEGEGRGERGDPFGRPVAGFTHPLRHRPADRHTERYAKSISRIREHDSKLNRWNKKSRWKSGGVRWKIKAQKYVIKNRDIKCVQCSGDDLTNNLGPRPRTGSGIRGGGARSRSGEAPRAGGGGRPGGRGGSPSPPSRAPRPSTGTEPRRCIERGGKEASPSCGLLVRGIRKVVPSCWICVCGGAGAGRVDRGGSVHPNEQ